MINIVKTVSQGHLLRPRDTEYSYPYAYEIGGVRLQDTSQGLLSHVWELSHKQGKFLLRREDEANSLEILSVGNVDNFDFSFDQNMSIVIVWELNQKGYIYFFDTQLNGYNTKKFENVRTPKVTLDDKRNTQIHQSNVLLTYVNGNNLCIRYQNERFNNEYILKQYNKPIYLWRVSMNKHSRIAFHIR